MNTCEEIKECIACGSKELTPILDLGSQPLANSYKKKEKEDELFFPLAITHCNYCFHVQLTHKVTPDLLFKNYLYVSGTTKTQLDYFDWFSKFILENQGSCETVLDIGCNDGSQLNYFKQLGLKTYGIDPAINLYELSSKNHTVVCDYFRENSFKQKFDIIVCQNAFPHNYDQLGFLTNAKKLMSDKSRLYIVTSQVDMIKNNEFDTIYHEHLSFYNIKSMNELCKRAGLNLIDVVQHPIHGKSNIFLISRRINRENYINNMIEMEKLNGIYSVETYKKYAINARKIVKKFIRTVHKLKNENIPIVGYGAPAKGNTLLNYAKVKPDFIVDDNPLKQGLFTPGMSVPIKSPDYLNKYKNIERVCFVPLAWNFFNEIKTRIEKLRPEKSKDLYLKYFPKIVLHSND